MCAGVLADRYGRLRVVVTLIVAYILTGLAGGLTTSLVVWLSLRFLMGAASIGMHTVRYTMQVYLHYDFPVGVVDPDPPSIGILAVA